MTPQETVEFEALIKVAEAAAALFRPPYRRFAGVPESNEGKQEIKDFRRLYDALHNENCIVEVGEELT